MIKNRFYSHIRRNYDLDNYTKYTESDASSDSSLGLNRSRS